MLKMEYLFVSLFSVISTQNLGSEIPTIMTDHFDRTYKLMCSVKYGLIDLISLPYSGITLDCLDTYNSY